MSLVRFAPVLISINVCDVILDYLQNIPEKSMRVCSISTGRPALNFQESLQYNLSPWDFPADRLFIKFGKTALIFVTTILAAKSSLYKKKAW